MKPDSPAAVAAIQPSRPQVYASISIKQSPVICFSLQMKRLISEIQNTGSVESAGYHSTGCIKTEK
jgi:hypothetical protein